MPCTGSAGMDPQAPERNRPIARKLRPTPLLGKQGAEKPRQTASAASSNHHSRLQGPLPQTSSIAEKFYTACHSAASQSPRATPTWPASLSGFTPYAGDYGRAGRAGQAASLQLASSSERKTYVGSCRKSLRSLALLRHAATTRNHPARSQLQQSQNLEFVIDKYTAL